MRKTILFGILVLLPAAIVSGASLFSCAQLECATGTHEEGGQCVASLPNECGPGTTSTGGKCEAVPNPCGLNTSWNFDAGQCEGRGGGVDPDAGMQMRGARWNQFLMVKPESIATLANIQLPGYFSDGTIVVILRTEPLDPGNSVWLHGGTGVKMNDEPLTYTFTEGFKPEAVLAELGTPVTGTDDKLYTPFETTSTFDWTFKFLPDQPSLYMFNASLTGTLDPEGIPNSNEEPGNLSGTFKGCFLKYGVDCLTTGICGADDVYLEVLSQNMRELIESSGGNVDTDCNESGSLNGYLLEAKWQSQDENMDLVPPTAQDDGGVGDDAGTQVDAATD